MAVLRMVVSILRLVVENCRLPNFIICAIFVFCWFQSVRVPFNHHSGSSQEASLQSEGNECFFFI